MEATVWIKTLAISFLLLPFFSFLNLLLKSALRFTIPSIQLFFSTYFTWTSDSQFFHYAYYLHSDQRISKDSSIRALCLKLSVKKYEKMMKEEISDCAICLCGVEEGDEVNELSCKHLFHRACLERWIIVHSSATCPLCRNSVLPCEAKLKVEYIDEEEYEDLTLPLVAYVQCPWWIW